MKGNLIDAISNIREKDALRVAEEMLNSGADPEALLDAARDAMAIIGGRFESKRYFLPELLMGSEILRSIADLVKPRLKVDATGQQAAARVVLGTVAGDIHDIGKDIVAFMLDCNRFEVHDLGVDVPVRRFVEKIRETNAPIVGLSGFLTLAFDQMKATVDAIEAAGLRDSLKIMIGGAIMDDSAAKFIGADAYGADASAAVRLAKSWTA